MADNKLIHYDPSVGEWPRISKIADSTVRVYWDASQGISVNEPPTYVAPTDWPVANTLMRRPRAFRIVTELGGGGQGGGTQTCDTIKVTYTADTNPIPRTGPDPGTSFQSIMNGSFHNATFCECDMSSDPVLNILIPVDSGSPSTVGFTAQQMQNVAYLNAFFKANLYYSDQILPTDDVIFTATPVTQDPGGCSGTTPGGEWFNAASDLDLPARVRVVTDDTLEANYLSPVSVASDDVPASPTDYQFIGGEALNVVVLRSDTGLNNYLPATVLASAEGLRIAAAYPFFKAYRTVLVADLRGTISATFRTQLQQIVAKLAPYNFRYAELPAAGDISSLLAEIAAAFYN